MNRRGALIALLAFSQTLRPAAVCAQPARVRRVGILMPFSEGDAELQTRLAAFKEQLNTLGWSEGKNLVYDIRWTSGDLPRGQLAARDLVARQPDIIFSTTTPATAALARETRTIPLVFAVVTDPVGSGLVTTFSRPGGNVTGLVNIEPLIVQKWIEILREIAPRLARVEVMYNPETAPYTTAYLSEVKPAAAQLRVAVSGSPVRSRDDIDVAIARAARENQCGLIVMVDSFLTVHRDAVIASTARRKVPAMYYNSFNVTAGGLVSYGAETVELFRQAAVYADRILRGAKAADLPVTFPTKFELAVNLRTAAALGLTIPESLLARAQVVVE